MRRSFQYLKARVQIAAMAYPRMLAFALVVCFAVLLFAGALFSANDEREERVTVKVGIVGSLEDTYIELGIFALRNMDTSRYYVEFTALDEEQAKEMLEGGELIGYLVIPEGFADAALGGDAVELDYICADSPATLVPQLMNEVVETVSGYITESQNGIYSFMQFCRDRDIPRSEYRSSADLLAVEYLQTILSRGEIWETQTVGLGAGLDFKTYYFCAFFVLLLMLFGISAAPVMIKEDMSLPRVLKFKKTGAIFQIIAEYIPFFLMIQLTSVFLLTGALILGVEGVELRLLWQTVPAVLLISCMQFFLYEISSGVIGGTFLQLFAAVSLSLVSGFFFPSSSLPDAVSAFASVLPTRTAFDYTAESVKGGGDILPVVLSFAVLFILTLLARKVKIGGTVK